MASKQQQNSFNRLLLGYNRELGASIPLYFMRLNHVDTLFISPKAHQLALFYILSLFSFLLLMLVFLPHYYYYYYFGAHHESMQLLLLSSVLTICIHQKQTTREHQTHNQTCTAQTFIHFWVPHCAYLCVFFPFLSVCYYFRTLHLPH